MSLFSIFLRSLVVALVLCAGLSVAAWSTPATTPPNGNTAASVWTPTAGGDIYFTGGNVGIETGNPSTKLEVGGTVKASKFESSQSATIRVSLATCPGGGGCPGHHTINQWYDVGLNYAHTNTNNDTSAYTPYNGRVTINKAGTYRVRVYSMVIPYQYDMSGLHVAPFINGSPSVPAGESFHHRYMPAGWWNQEVYEVTVTLAAGTTVSYGYMPHVALSYWAHDGYTSMEILRIN